MNPHKRCIWNTKHGSPAASIDQSCRSWAAKKKHMEAKELEAASKPYVEATETPNMDANEQANLQAVAIAQAT